MDGVHREDIDPRDFIVPASDDKGHSEVVRFRLQPGHAFAVSKIVQGKQHPYRTASDFYRHAVLLLLKYLSSIGPVPDVVQQVDAIIELVKEDRYDQQYRDVIDAIGERIIRNQNANRHGAAVRLLLRAMRLIDQMPSGDQKDQFVETFHERWGGLIEQMPKVSLIPEVTGGNTDESSM